MIEINQLGKEVLSAIGAPIGYGYGISKLEAQREQDSFDRYGSGLISPEIAVWVYTMVLMNNTHQKREFIKGVLALLEKQQQPHIEDINNGGLLHLKALEKRERAKGGDIKKAMRSAIYRGYSCIAGICAGTEKVIVADNAHQFVQLYDICPHKIPYDGGNDLTPKQMQENQELGALWDNFYSPILTDFKDFLNDNNFGNP
jgi:hypothetical protein